VMVLLPLWLVVLVARLVLVAREVVELLVEELAVLVVQVVP